MNPFIIVIITYVALGIALLAWALWSIFYRDARYRPAQRGQWSVSQDPAYVPQHRFAGTSTEDTRLLAPLSFAARARVVESMRREQNATEAERPHPKGWQEAVRSIEEAIRREQAQGGGDHQSGQHASEAFRNGEESGSYPEASRSLTEEA